jgi:hypothetical protein
MLTINLAFKQMRDGHWYPSHWHDRNFRPPTTQPIVDDMYVDHWRQVIQDESLSHEWFTDPSQRFASAQSPWPATTTNSDHH